MRIGLALEQEQSKQDVKPYFVLIVAVRDKNLRRNGNHNLSVAVARATTGVALPNLPLLLCLLLRFLIKKEFDASIVYLKYAAYFAQEKINLPGFEKFFFHAAGEEREHGIKLIEYALMRGKEPVNKNTFQLDYSYKVPAATTGLSALEDALKMEQEVTLSIRNLIKTCEGDKDDYHLVDYLTGEYLNEQHKGQGRKLAEFLFDKNHM
ncbi:conserved hypothetical protein [Culex quinquefasciatus]|uniref:Ferritin n=1 Tax=Culex quinquefasciatus TaxID=7176 RepID=B0WMP4_CULQU|nr:conserved hypothetical protein [Culex quinquefasciatus]|eukprot:XP_001849998.1 conserved hypothetical protein [Culex quinquefasciatus]